MKTPQLAITSMIFGLLLVSPTILPSNVNAITDVVVPPAVAEWEKSHPNFTGCLQGNLKTHVTKEVTCFQPGVIPSVMSIGSDLELQSPLKQFKSGIAANDIKCEQGLQLVIKAEDGSPACVKLDTAQT